MESPKYPKGTVAQQSPQPGVKLPRGETVTIWLSTGPPMQIVPDLSGLDWNRAAAAAKASALRIGNAGDIESPKYPKGTVAQQSPQPGAKLPRGETVTIWLSTGPSLIRVPHVIGMTEAEAAKLLQRTELRLRIAGEDYSTEQPENRVYWQDPVENSQRSAGSTVRVKISRGEEPGPWWQFPIALAAGAGLLLTAGYAIGKTVNRKPGEKKGKLPTRPKISVRRKGVDSEQEIEVEGDVSAVGSALRLRAIPDRGEQEIAKIDDNKKE
ncbi:MAG: PASTA domain-containing protein [Alphaproteobacteria bacterium]|nr:PASTA domain-containing protein [Alphaproteobacteria bacterium]